MITRPLPSLTLALWLLAACGRPEAGADARPDTMPDTSAPPDKMPDTSAPPDAMPDTSAPPDAMPDTAAPPDAMPDTTAATDTALVPPVPPRAPSLELAALDRLADRPDLPLADRLFVFQGLPACAADGMHVAFLARSHLVKGASRVSRTRPEETRSLRIVRILDGVTVEDHVLVSEHELVARDGEGERELVERLTPRLRNRLRTAQKALEPSEDSGLTRFREMMPLRRVGPGFSGQLGGPLRPPTATPPRDLTATVSPRPDGRLDILLPGFSPTLTAPLLTLSRPDCERPRSREPLPDDACLPAGCTTPAELTAVHVDEEFGVILARVEPLRGPCDPLPRHVVLPVPPPR